MNTADMTLKTGARLNEEDVATCRPVCSPEIVFFFL